MHTLIVRGGVLGSGSVLVCSSRPSSSGRHISHVPIQQPQAIHSPCSCGPASRPALRCAGQRVRINWNLDSPRTGKTSSSVSSSAVADTLASGSGSDASCRRAVPAHRKEGSGLNGLEAQSRPPIADRSGPLLPTAPVSRAGYVRKSSRSRLAAGRNSGPSSCLTASSKAASLGLSMVNSSSPPLSPWVVAMNIV